MNQIHCLLISSSTLQSHTIQFTIGPNEFAVVLFCVCWDICRIWVTWPFSIIFVCTTSFKVSILHLNHCSQWNSVRLTRIKPLLCLNSVFFPHQKPILYQKKIFRFYIVLKICKDSFSYITVICKLIIWSGSNFYTCHLNVNILSKL